MKDEKLYTQFGPIRSGFLVTLIFDFLTLGGSLILTSNAIIVKYVPKSQKFNNLSKTIIYWDIPTGTQKIFPGHQKSREKLAFLAIFSSTMRHNFAVVKATSIKVGFKMKYNCYILPIQVLKIFIWCRWGDIGV